MTITIPDEELRPIDWKAIECALHDFVVDAIGVPFIFERQNLPQPPYPYASGMVTAIDPEGGIPERRHQYNANADAGSEIEIVITGPFTFTFTVSVHVDPKSGAYDPLCDAKALGSRLQWGICQGAAISTFRSAGIAVVEELALTDSSVVVNGEWLSRFTWDVRLRSTATAVDFTGYIDKTTVSGSFPGHAALDFTETYDSTA